MIYEGKFAGRHLSIQNIEASKAWAQFTSKFQVEILEKVIEKTITMAEEDINSIRYRKSGVEEDPYNENYIDIWPETKSDVWSKEELEILSIFAEYELDITVEYKDGKIGEDILLEGYPLCGY